MMLHNDCVLQSPIHIHIHTLRGEGLHRSSLVCPHISLSPQEWHQKCSHYFILTASRGTLTKQALLTQPPGNSSFLGDIAFVLVDLNRP